MIFPEIFSNVLNSATTSTEMYSRSDIKTKETRVRSLVHNEWTVAAEMGTASADGALYASNDVH